TDTDTDTGVDPELGPLQSACMEGEDGSAAELASIRLSSTITWALDFDAAAEAIGMVDCSYTRTYAGLQRFGWSHLCPECDFIVRGDATMVAGLECYEQIAAEARSVRTELWAIEDGTKLHRSGRDQFPMPTVLAELEGASGDGAPVPVSWASEGNALSDGGSFSLAAEGTVGWSLDPEALQMDPMGPRAAPYACGWECEDPGDLSGVAPITEGEVIPNGRFRDQCGEPVDLWDFHGSYLVIEASQNDCGPCRSMADAHAAFVQEMRAAGIPVRVITLMGNGLSASWETPDAETVADWVQTYGLTEPVLADEAWALSYFPSFIEEYSGESYGYPAWIVVDPALRAIHGNVGFSSWDAVAAVIQAD
ncbi:MAG: redoxin domain-containing protein, partial [Myxococcota bacterium]|nr:redoxin domain-containing protein [Myxococcota bacterium]